MSEASDKPVRGRPKTFDRDRVIDVAMNAYWREGLDAVSLNELCRRAQVSKPGLYREFGGEDDLMDAVLAHYAEEVLAPTLEQTTADRPFRDVLGDLVWFMTDADRAQPAGCLFAKMRTSSYRLGEATRSRVELLRQDALSRYADWVERAKERGEVDRSVPTAVAAAFLDVQFTTLLVQMAAGEDPEMLRAQAQLAFAGLTGFDTLSEA